jgi:hypothetical protein
LDLYGERENGVVFRGNWQMRKIFVSRKGAQLSLLMLADHCSRT